VGIITNIDNSMECDYEQNLMCDKFIKNDDEIHQIQLPIHGKNISLNNKLCKNELIKKDFEKTKYNKAFYKYTN